MSSSHKTSQVFGPPELFATDMRKVINDPEHSDIVFVVGEDRERIHAHKIILAARCEVFRAMFADQAKASTSNRTGKSTKDNTMLLVLPEVRPTVFLTVLEHIYANSCKLSQSIVVDVLASAIEYGLDGLVTCCVKYISDPNVDTVCEAIQAAITYNQEELRDTCMKFIETNTVVRTHQPRGACACLCARAAADLGGACSGRRSCASRRCGAGAVCPNALAPAPAHPTPTCLPPG